MAFDTTLSPTEEATFQTWKSQVAPNDSGEDYDFRGAFKAGLTPDPSGHWPDTFKKPNHPTFSVESIYAKDQPQLAGRWEGETFIPPQSQSQSQSPQSVLNLPVIEPTAEEQSAYEQQFGPPPLNPIRDLSAPELADLASADKENFELISAFRQNQNLWGDASVVQKVADANNLIRQRGFSLSDLPTPRRAAGMVWDVAKGFGKQLWNYGTAAVTTGMGIAADVVGSPMAREFEQEAQRRVAENIAGSEQALFGLAEMGERAIGKVGRAVGVAQPLAQQTPDQKVADLWKAVGVGETQEEIARGRGGFLQPVGGEVISELEAAGKPVRPEETAALAAGDPFSFYLFGKGFQAVGTGARAAGRALPVPAQAAITRAGAATERAAERAAGITVQAAGKLTELGGRALQITGRAAPVVAAGGAIAAGEPISALAILGGGTAAGRTVQALGRRGVSAGQRIQEVGRQVGGKPIVAPTAQAIRDVARTTPAAVGEIASGTAADIGLAAVSSETPLQTEGAIGIGTVFGGLAGARRIAGRVLSGQLIAPREYGVANPVPSSGSSPTLDAMHTTAFAAAPPGVRARLNAVREFARGANLETDVFLAPDAPTLERALIQSGVDANTARLFSQQEGFFTTNLPDRSGQPRRVIVAKNVEAAPHESFHALQDVLGESANREIDAIVRQEYGPRWDAEGARYASRLVRDPGNRAWEEVILDESGWGLDAAKEKIYRETYNRLESETGATPSEQTVRDLVDPELVRIFNDAQSRNPDANPNQFWREVLSPEEAKFEADRYIARELAAENFDAVFKNLGAGVSPGTLPQRISRIVGNLVSTLGGEPLAGRRTEIGQIEPRFSVTQRVAEVARGRLPTAEPAPTDRPVPPVSFPKGSLPATPEARQAAADEARTIAGQAPDTPVAAGTRSPRELLGVIAEAMAQQAGVRINYRSAPDVPAAATTSNRTARREIIEAYRTMPAAARSLWEKSFFPERVIQTKGAKYQVMGWAPEVFASNAHKLAKTLSELPDGQRLTPYELDLANKTFTETGWRQLFEDTQRYVQNQISGRTGAGEPLVVPRGITEQGFFAPAVRGSSAGLDQVRADTINMLFNFRLPNTPRISRGRLPLNIAGQEVSIATTGGPQRLSVPVEPRQPFTGEAAQQLGIEGRTILEVNPVRGAIEQAASQAKVTMPEFIEAIQRLNLENIKEVEVVPELPQFRGNTLTLSAGFQPSSDPRAIKAAAVRDRRGRVFEGSWHGEARDVAEGAGVTGWLDDGFTTNSGEFLSREEAFQRAQEINQLPQQTGRAPFASAGVLESQELGALRQFQPVAVEAQRIIDMPAEEWNTMVRGYKGKLGDGLTGYAWDLGASAKSPNDALALKSIESQLRELARSLPSGDFTARGNIISKAQAVREAYEAATGENIEGTNEGSAVPGIRKYVDPNYQPPIKGQAQPKTETERARTGLAFKQFFSDVTRGKFGKSDVPFEPVLDLEGPIEQSVISEQLRHTGNFDEHIAKSIPAFKDVQIKKAGAIVAAYPEGADVLDIGASEGSLMKTISALSDGNLRTVSLDPNPDMAKFFRTKSQVPGAEFEEAAFLRGFEDEGRTVPAFDTDTRFDVINESMAFQFISPERSAQITEAKRLLKPDGILIIEEKVRNPNWNANEKLKDTEYKNRYFSKEDLTAKEKKVGFSQSKDESKAVGMVDNMVSDIQLEDILRGQFKHVTQYWDSGNFKGYVASDSKPALDRFVFQVGDTDSKFSTTKTPRPVEGMTAEEMRARPSSGFDQFQPIPARDWTQLIDQMRKSGKIRGVSSAPEYVETAQRMNQGFTPEEWSDFSYSLQKRMHDLVEFAEGSSAARYLNHLGVSPLEGYTPPEPRFSKVSGSEAEWRAVVRSIVENSNMTWFRGVGGTEALNSVKEKIVKGEITPANYKTLAVSTESAIAEAMFTLQEAAQNAGSLNKVEESAIQKMHFTRDSAADIRNMLAGRWGEDIADRVISGQLQPETEGEFTLRKPSGGFSKAWILPDGTPVQLGGQFHHDWLNENPDVRSRFGIPDDTQDASSRIEALKKGFARINYGQNGGRLTVEARAADWNKIKPAIQQFVETNLDSLDNMRVELFNDDVSATVDSGSAAFHRMTSDAERLSNIPFVTGELTPPTGGTAGGQVTGIAQARSRQFQPAQEELLPGMEGLAGRGFLSTSQISAMSRRDLMEFYPEAIVPQKKTDSIPSDLIGSPLAKQARREKQSPEQAFANKLVEFARSQESRPEYNLGRKWYSEFSGQLKKLFGDDARIMAELLAATSPQTAVEVNYRFALDALEGFKSGRFKPIIKKYEQGLRMIAEDNWRAWYNKEVKAGRVPEPPANPGPATFLEHWIETHNLKPRQSNGALYGINSVPVLQVMARRWLDQVKGPKVRNFVENLLGEGQEATIDLWADRTLRRLGYQDFAERWRILPQNKSGVTDADFEFAQSIFRNAAKQLNMKPSELQAAIWFAEKQLWADNGWVRLDLGDFREELKKTEKLRQEIRARGQPKIETPELTFVEPRAKVK